MGKNNKKKHLNLYYVTLLDDPDMGFHVVAENIATIEKHYPNIEEIKFIDDQVFVIIDK